ncbi:MAG: ABC transporter permease [Desulfobacula sp.]|jgi:peptide/nickel transport system permease protein|nr:ABC transporter permease [Desulfobacula sp.]
MLTYLIKRLGLAILIVILAVVILYSLIHIIPGNPVNVILGPRATPEMKEILFAKMGLDRPFIVQVASFLSNTLKGDLGWDFFSHQPVAAIIKDQLPYTLILVLTGIGWAIILGLPLGCYSAINRYNRMDKLTGILSVSVIAIPSFVVSVYTLLIFAVMLKWLPAIGVGAEGDFWDQFIHLLMPAFAIGLSWVGYIARLIRASMLEVMGENHIRMVRAFGLPERLVIFRYALMVSILPTICLLGVGSGHLLSTAVFAEIIFARPGIGKLIYDSVITRNYPVVMGCVLVTSVLFVLCTTLTDILTAGLDPRIRENL